MSRFLTSHTSLVKMPQILAAAAQGLAWMEKDATGRAVSKQASWGTDQETKSAVELWEKTVSQRKWSASEEVLLCLQSDVIHHWLQPVPAQTQSLVELHTIANTRAKTLFGNSGKQTWLVSAQWDYKRPFVCAAVASSWEDLFSTIRKTHPKLRIVGNFDLAISVHGKSLPREGWLAMLIEHKLYLQHFQNGHATSLRTLRLSEYCNSNSIEAAVIQEWNREKIRTQQTTDQLVWFNKPKASETVHPIQGSVLALEQAHQLLAPGASHVC